MKTNHKRPETCSLAAYARLHNVSKRTATNWKRAGYIAVADDGAVNVRASDTRLAGRPRVYRGGTAKGPAGGIAEAEFEMQTAALSIALKRLIASDRKSGSLDELIESVNGVLKMG